MLSCFWTRVRAVVHRRGDRGREGTAPRRVYFHRRIEEEEDKEEDRWWIEGKDDRVGFACRGATTKAARSVDEIFHPDGHLVRLFGRARTTVPLIDRAAIVRQV